MLIDSSRISEKELAAMLRALLTARGWNWKQMDPINKHKEE